MLKKFLLLAVPALVLAGCTSQPTATPTPETTTESQMNIAVTPVEEVSMEKKSGFTLEEIAKHNSADDCWFAIEGKVYDVTPFIATGKHPGGEAILQGCGKDATSLFNNRPTNGTAHSQQARMNLENYEIGPLVTE